MTAEIASLWRTALSSLAPREPTRCPYCPERSEPHWICWGCYWRYVERRQGKIDVGRHRCRFKKRTFSLLPDGLLPHHYARTATILYHLWKLFVEGVRATLLAHLRHVARTTVRRIRDRAASILKRLRLPGKEGALTPGDFLTRLLALGAEVIAQIFRDWKELQPKHSVVGFYRR
jgi:hypothetical protein